LPEFSIGLELFGVWASWRRNKINRKCELYEREFISFLGMDLFRMENLAFDAAMTLAECR
jgi:hypothetical protein